MFRFERDNLDKLVLNSLVSDYVNYHLCDLIALLVVCCSTQIFHTLHTYFLLFLQILNGFLI